jgi:hypothetical protein
MAKQAGTTETSDGRGGEVHIIDANDEATAAAPAGNGDDFVVAATTVGVICVGAALFEAALIPGMVIGVAAMLAPKALPKLGAAVEPAFREAVRGTYKLGQKARHIIAEAEEQVHDIVAEEKAAGAAAKPNV